MEEKLRPGSLTNEEVAIVINLLKRETYQNQEILGIINAVRRQTGKPDTNNGRITEVKYITDGQADKLSPAKLARYTGIKPASDKQTEEFLEQSNNIAAAPIVGSLSPVDDKILKELLPVKSDNPLILDITETDRIECKETFNYVIETIAAFANNKGGYFVFGVKDKTWEVIGLSDKKLGVFNEYDLKTINTKIRNKLGVDLQIQKHLFDIKGKKVGILYIAPAHIKPLIFVSGDGDTTQGHIYYRYSGEDRLISPQELQKLIEDRIRQMSETVLMKHLSNIFKNGIENSAVMNVSTGEVLGKSGSFVIDESLLPKLRFIKEGVFVEKDGEPTLKLLGELRTSTVVHKFLEVHISEIDLIEAFLKQEIPSNPEAYIRRYSESAKDWLPIYYFAKIKGISLNELIEYLKKNTSIRQPKLEKTKSGRKPANLYNAKSFATEIADLRLHKKLNFSKFESCKKYLRALQCWNFSENDQDYVLALLKNIYDLFYKHSNNDDQGLIRTAAAYADSIIYRPQITAGIPLKIGTARQH